MTGHGQRVIGVVTVIDIGDAKLNLEHCCRKGHVIVSTPVVFPEWSGRRAGRRIESPPIDPRHATMQQRQVNRLEDGPAWTR